MVGAQSNTQENPRIIAQSWRRSSTGSFLPSASTALAWIIGAIRLTAPKFRNTPSMWLPSATDQNRRPGGCCTTNRPIARIDRDRAATSRITVSAAMNAPKNAARSRALRMIVALSSACQAMKVAPPAKIARGSFAQPRRFQRRKAHGQKRKPRAPKKNGCPGHHVQNSADKQQRQQPEKTQTTGCVAAVCLYLVLGVTIDHGRGSMPDVNFAVRRLTIPPGGVAQTEGLALVLVHEGAVTADSTMLEAGCSHVLPARAGIEATGKTPAEVIAFLLTPHPVENALAQERVEITFPCLWRLDEVAFPPGAIAYRHVHPGPGFRHLRHGALHLQADAHSFTAQPGSTWFEAADAPVRATADADLRETRFVRSLILPVALAGKPSIRILAPGDRAKPRLQKTHRHVDHILSHWPQVDAG